MARLVLLGENSGYLPSWANATLKVKLEPKRLIQNVHHMLLRFNGIAPYPQPKDDVSSFNAVPVKVCDFLRGVTKGVPFSENSRNCLNLGIAHLLPR